MNVGKSIRIACAKNDINQKKLASMANVTSTTISLIATGKQQCSQKMLEKLAAAFDMPVSEFIALGE